MLWTDFRKRNLTIVLGILCALTTWLFGLRPFVVNGISMYPTFNATPIGKNPSLIGGDYLVIDIFSYTFLREPERFDVVVFRSPVNPRQHLIKRIIGLPNESVRLSEDTVTVITSDGDEILLDEQYINREEVTVYREQTVGLGGDQYFLLGDNRLNSYDSRVWHGLDRKHIIGQVLVRLYPFSSAEVYPGEA